MLNSHFVQNNIVRLLCPSLFIQKRSKNLKPKISAMCVFKLNRVNLLIGVANVYLAYWIYRCYVCNNYLFMCKATSVQAEKSYK